MVLDKDTNFVYVSNKLQEWYGDTFRRLTKLFDELEIEWGIIPSTNDIWARDYMPIQLSDNDFLNYRYWPDYLIDNNEIEYVTDSNKACRKLGINAKRTVIKLDGGNVTLCGNYLVMTDKVFTENGKEKYDAEFKSYMEGVFGLEIIFIPWHKITDDEPYGHSDGIIHWCGGNSVLMTDHFKSDEKEAEEIKTKLEEKGFNVTIMEFNVSKPDYNLNWAYINYLQVGNIIIMPAFGIDEDRKALKYISQYNPECKVYPFRMKNLVADGGGALHCITWNLKTPCR